MIYNRSLQDDYLDYRRDKDNLIPFLLGRNGINYLIKSLEIKAILLPSYICPMVIDIFNHYEVEVFFYQNLNKQLEVPVNDILITLKGIECSKKLFFLWHDYLNIVGDMPDELYDYLKNNNIDSIIDAAHTLPIKNYRCDNVLYGFRKLLNQPFGSFLKLDKHQNIKQKSYPRTRIWLFCLVYKVKAILYSLFKDFDNKYCDNLLKFLSGFDKQFSFDISDLFLHEMYSYKKIENLHSSLDYKKICQKRKKNFLQYHEHLQNRLSLSKLDISCPFGFPFIVKDNQEVRKKLWDKGVHSFILWHPLNRNSTKEADEYSNYLSHSNIILPVNQDLSSSDIDKIIEILNA